MAVNLLNVELREKTGHHAPKILRKNGRIPGIFYASGEDSISVSLNEKELEKLLHKEVNIIDLKFSDTKTRKSILREVQRDPVSDKLIHIDIMGIKLDEKIHIKIPIILLGTPTGVKEESGILNHLLRTVEVEGLPLDIPEHIEIDVSSLNIGDVITLEDFPEDKYSFAIDKSHSVATVIKPKVEEVVTEEEEEEGELVEGEEGVEGEGEEGSKEEGSKEEDSKAKDSKAKDSKAKDSKG